MGAQLPVPTVGTLALLFSLGVMLGSRVGGRVSPLGRRSPGEALGPHEALAAGPGCKPDQSGISPSFDQQKLQEALSSQREKMGRCVPWDCSSCDSNPKEQNSLGE